MSLPAFPNRRWSADEAEHKHPGQLSWRAPVGSIDHFSRLKKELRILTHPCGNVQLHVAQRVAGKQSSVVTPQSWANPCFAASSADRRLKTDDGLPLPGYMSLRKKTARR